MKPKEKYILNMPPMAQSSISTLGNKTGSWKYIRPIYQDKTPPCNHKCPAGEETEGWIYYLAHGQIENAISTLVNENPFPAIMGRVCFHPCELGCNRKDYDEAISINALERFIGDSALNTFKVMKPTAMKDKKVAIVGGGPAGLSCAYFLGRLGYQCTIFEAKKELGGILRYGIPEYRLPKKILKMETAFLSHLPVTIKTGHFIGRDISWETLEKDFDAIFIATGAHKGRNLDVPGEGSDIVISGLSMLNDLATGKEIPEGREVIIIGGGNTAMDCARSLIRKGRRVRVFYRRTIAEMPANPEEIDHAIEEGVEFQYLAAPVRISRKDGCLLVDMIKMELGPPDSSGRRSPKPVEGSESSIQCDIVVKAIGEECDLSTIPQYINSKMGSVIVDVFGRTNHPKYWAGGDLIPISRTATHAIGSGKWSAIGIDAVLSERQLPTENMIRIGEMGSASFGRYISGEGIPRTNGTRDVVSIKELNLAYFDHRRRIKRPLNKLNKRTSTFKEVIKRVAEAKILFEAGRCFNCAVCNECKNCYIFCPDNAIKISHSERGFFVDYDYCKGCGICVTECPRDAMAMIKEEE